ncbi:MAG TPA: SMC-Scp complex subunit ScpB [Bacillales bacterium]|nr:SMC-Scp complex subunit ScpB [Bacillales bacterium]
MNKTAIVEGLLFLAGDDGLEAKEIANVLEMDVRLVEELMEQMKMNYAGEANGFELVEIAGTYKFMTKPELAPYIQKLLESPGEARLSQAALETLAIVAYKQPITRAEIEDIRGVKTEKVLQTLAAHALIKEVGRAEGTGRAILYGTTDEFLQYFGLHSLQELPPFPDELEKEANEEIELFEKNDPALETP